MKIENCRVAINSNEEFKKVEEICFANDIGWWNVGKKHRGGLTEDLDAIEISDELTQTKRSYNNYITQLSFDEFIEKYGKNKDNNIMNRVKTLFFKKEPVRLNDNLFNKLDIKLNQNNIIDII